MFVPSPSRPSASSCAVPASPSGKRCFGQRAQRHFGAIFAVSSVLVPYCFGAIAGGIASGRVPAGGQAGDPLEQLGQPDLGRRGLARRIRDGLRRRGISHLGCRSALRRRDGRLLPHPRRGGGVVAGAVALVGLFVVRNEARYVFDGLTSRALPLVDDLGARRAWRAFAAAGPTAPRGPAGCGIAAAGALVLGWGVAQWDYLLPESLTVSQAAAPTGHDHGRAGRGRSRRAVDRARLRLVVHARPEGPASGRRRRRAVPTRQPGHVRLTDRSAHAPPILRHRADPVNRRTSTCFRPMTADHSPGKRDPAAVRFARSRVTPSMRSVRHGRDRSALGVAHVRQCRPTRRRGVRCDDAGLRRGERRALPAGARRGQRQGPGRADGHQGAARDRCGRPPALGTDPQGSRSRSTPRPSRTVFQGLRTPLTGRPARRPDPRRGRGGSWSRCARRSARGAGPQAACPLHRRRLPGRADRDRGRRDTGRSSIAAESTDPAASWPRSTRSACATTATWTSRRACGCSSIECRSATRSSTPARTRSSSTSPSSTQAGAVRGGPSSIALP